MVRRGQRVTVGPLRGPRFWSSGAQDLIDGGRAVLDPAGPTEASGRDQRSRLPQLKWVDACIKEAQRLHSPLPTPLPRSAVYSSPRGAVLSCPPVPPPSLLRTSMSHTPFDRNDGWMRTPILPTISKRRFSRSFLDPRAVLESRKSLACLPGSH
jgi:hypothetical protein